MSDQPEPTSDDTTLLRQFLASRDVPCPVCGYNLRGTTSTKCPECGALIRLHLAFDERHTVLWLVSLFTIALPLGASLAFFALISLLRLDAGYYPGGLILVASLLVSGLVYLSVVILLVQKRKWFWRGSLGRQLGITLGCVFLAIVGVAGFVLALFNM